MNLQAQCKARVEEAFKQAEAHYGRTFQRCPVVFSEKMTTCGGTALSSRFGEAKKITLSAPLLRLNTDVFIARTPGHEAAHIIANQLVRGGAGHGAVWVQVMRVIGQKPERCHNMEVARKTGIDASCGCAVHQITAQRAAKIKRGAIYKCRQCKVELTLGAKKELIKPKAVPVVPAPAPVAKTVPTPVVNAPVEGMSKVERVREIIRNNPTKTLDQIVKMVAESDIGMSPSNIRNNTRNQMLKMGRQV